MSPAYQSSRTSLPASESSSYGGEVVPGLRRLAILGNVGNPFTVLELAGMLASLIDGRLFLAHSYPSLRSIEAINLIGD